MSAALDLAARVRSLPTFPAVALQLRGVLADEHSTLSAIERVVAQDPALTSNLLRLANSARFGLRRQVGSVGHAVTLLGRGRVQALVLEEALTHVVPARIPGFELSSARFFAHGLAVATLSARLVAARGGGDAGFVAGLLHDIGKLVVGVALAAEAAQARGLLAEPGITLLEVERRTLGVDHATAGALAAKRWGLPPVVVAVCAHHHEPDGAGAHALVVDAVHLANALAHSLGFGADVGELRRRPEPGPMRRLELHPRDLERLASDALDEILAATALYHDERET